MPENVPFRKGGKSMKKGSKWIAALLTASMMFTLAGCGNGEAGSSGDDGGKEETWERAFDKYIQDEEAVDLGGYEFHIVDFNSNIWGPDEIKSPQDQLIVDIIEDVENKFNCTITFEEVSPDKIYDTANPSLMAGDKFADLVGTTMWAFGTLLSSNHVADVSNVESLDLSLDCFNHNLSDMATFGDSVYGFGAAFGSHLTNHWVIFYNARIWDELGLPDPYDLARNNEWTWDKLVEYAKKALLDNDGNGIVDSESDRWGMVAPSGDLMRGMYISMGGTFYESNSEGKMRLSCLDSASADKMTFCYNFFQKDKVLYMNENEGYKELFAAGKALFLAYGNGTFDELKEMEDDFGVLPMPKWDASQESFLNPIDHNAKIYCMTDTNRNTYEAGVIITALAKRYQAYDDLKLEEMEDIYWRFDEDAEMVRNYVVGHGGYNVIDVIKRANSTFEMPSSAMWDGVYNNMYTDITSTIASAEDALNIYLDEFFDNLSK